MVVRWYQGVMDGCLGIAKVFWVIARVLLGWLLGSARVLRVVIRVLLCGCYIVASMLFCMVAK